MPAGCNSSKVLTRPRPSPRCAAIEPDLAKLNAINSLPHALLFNRQYADVKSFYEKDTGHARWSYRLAAIAATDGVAAALAAWEHAQSGETRQSVFTEAADYLMLLQEYAAAVGLLREAMKEENETAQLDLDVLARTRTRANARFSNEASIALTQRLIYALLDPEDEGSWRQLYVEERRGQPLRTERDQLFRFLGAWRQVAKRNLGWISIADVVVSNAEFVSEGSDQTGYRVRVADPRPAMAR